MSFLASVFTAGTVIVYWEYSYLWYYYGVQNTRIVYSFTHSVLLQYIMVCLEYTVSSGIIIIIESLDCTSIGVFSTRYIRYCYSVLRVQLFLVLLLQCTEYTHVFSIIHSVLLQYIILCLEYTVSSGIIIIEFIDCISIWDISTRYIVYLYVEYYLSVRLAVRPWEDLAVTRDIYIYIYN